MAVIGLKFSRKLAYLFASGYDSKRLVCASLYAVHAYWVPWKIEILDRGFDCWKLAVSSVINPVSGQEVNAACKVWGRMNQFLEYIVSWWKITFAMPPQKLNIQKKSPPRPYVDDNQDRYAITSYNNSLCHGITSNPQATPFDKKSE